MLAFAHMEYRIAVSRCRFDFDVVFTLHQRECSEPVLDTNRVLSLEEFEELASRVFIDDVRGLRLGSGGKVWAPIGHVFVLLVDFHFVSDCA